VTVAADARTPYRRPMSTGADGPPDTSPPMRGPAEPDEEGRLPGDGDEPFAWGRPRGRSRHGRKDLYGALAASAVPGLFGFMHWAGFVLAAVGALPFLVFLVRGIRSDSGDACRVVVEPGAPRRITLHRAGGRLVVRSLDDVRETQPLLVGYTGGETEGVRVLALRIGRRKYRTDSHYTTDDSEVRALAQALGRACPNAPVRPLKDKRYALTPD